MNYNPNYTGHNIWRAEQQARHQLNEMYAHPMDEDIIKGLRFISKLMADNQQLRASIEHQIEYQYGQYMQSSLLITPDKMPRIYNIMINCAERLLIPIPYTVIGQGMEGLNAFTVGTDQFAYLVLSPRLTVGMKDPELTFVIGHECGHVALEHVLYHTMFEMNFQIPNFRMKLMKAATTGMVFRKFLERSPANRAEDANLIQQGWSAFLAGWQRRSEVSADRAGLLCNRNLRAAERSLIMTTINDTGVSVEDIDYYLEALAIGEKPAFLDNLFSRHPHVLRRIEALRVFANSVDYYMLTGEPLPPTPVYDRDTMLSIVNRIVGL